MPEVPLTRSNPDWRPPAAIRASAVLHAAAAATAVMDPALWLPALAAVAANHAALALAGMVPQSRLLGSVIARLPGAGVALTFDDGPDPAVTPRVLDLLDRAGATATFFCIGRRAQAHPQIVRDIVRRGHAVENHTMTHPNGFAFFMPPQLRREIVGADAALQAITGRQPRFFRPPMGLRGPPLDYVLATTGHAQVSWTRRGYDTVRRDTARMLRRLTHGLDAGDILLLHDGNGACDDAGRPVVLSVLPALLAHLAAHGLRTVPLATPAAAAATQSPASAVYASR